VQEGLQEEDGPRQSQVREGQEAQALTEERAVTLNDVIWAGQRLRDERGGHDGRTGLENLIQQREIRRQTRADIGSRP
jgi:hypothetical protein